MKKDISHRNDIELLVNSFYDKVKGNAAIGHIFSDVANVNWELHLPIMYNFWSGILLDDHSYSGNPMVKHIALNKKYSLTETHFQVWIQLFQQTVDELFVGVKADEAKTRAGFIAQIMLQKIKISERDTFNIIDHRQTE